MALLGLTARLRSPLDSTLRVLTLRLGRQATNRSARVERSKGESGMTMGKARSAAPHWPSRATGKAMHVRQVTVLALLADVLYRIAIRSHVRRAIGI
jgi:hypothetical protein